MRLVVVEFMTLDGVMEAPGFEEHRAGRNAWAMRTSDEKLQENNRQQIFEADALLFGRTTFNIWAAFWPGGPDTAGMTERINEMPKYVVSKTLQHSDWAHTTILGGDLRADIEALKAGADGSVFVYGSADLVQGLLDLDLVDELRLTVFPVVLGSGKRLFRDEAELRYLRLIRAEAFESGAINLVYERSDEPPTEQDLADFEWTPEIRESFRALEESDRVLATVLFTDIVDSTGIAARLGDREWRRLLGRYEETARAEIARWRGQLVKRTGDGVLARFDSPSRALRCALAMRGASGRLGMVLRAGIHTGEIEVRGEDVGGIAVNIASRVLASAGSGQVVVTRTVRDLATGTDIGLEAVGEVELRGVPGRWELFEATQGPGGRR